MTEGKNVSILFPRRLPRQLLPGPGCWFFYGV